MNYSLSSAVPYAPFVFPSEHFGVGSTFATWHRVHKDVLRICCREKKKKNFNCFLIPLKWDPELSLATAFTSCLKAFPNRDAFSSVWIKKWGKKCQDILVWGIFFFETDHPALKWNLLLDALSEQWMIWSCLRSAPESCVYIPLTWPHLLKVSCI